MKDYNIGVGDRVRVDMSAEDMILFYYGISDLLGKSGEIVQVLDKESSCVLFANGVTRTFYNQHLRIISKAPEGYNINSHTFTIKPISDFILEYEDSDGDVDYDFEPYDICAHMFDVRVRIEESLAINDIEGQGNLATL